MNVVAATRKARARHWWLSLGALLLATTGRAQETAPWPRPGAYAGPAACVRCREAQHQRLLRGAHAAILDAAALPGCETCHGPGKAHAADEGEDPLRITMPAKLAAKAQVAFCGRCHEDQIEQHGGDPAGSRDSPDRLPRQLLRRAQ